MFITFEGIDGCGKTTQVELLKSYFEKFGNEVISIREPGSTNISEQIREILLNPENKELSSESEALLFASARAQIVEEVIKPSLEKNIIVICDRFIDSTIAYQGFGRGMEIEYLNKINSFATQNILPEYTFFIDISIEESQNRLSSANLDRMESIGSEFFENVRKGFVNLSDKYPDRIHKIDGELPMNKIQEKINSIIFSH